MRRFVDNGVTTTEGTVVVTSTHHSTVLASATIAVFNTTGNSYVEPDFLSQYVGFNGGQSTRGVSVNGSFSGAGQIVVSDIQSGSVYAELGRLERLREPVGVNNKLEGMQKTSNGRPSIRVVDVSYYPIFQQIPYEEEPEIEAFVPTQAWYHS